MLVHFGESALHLIEFLVDLIISKINFFHHLVKFYPGVTLFDQFGCVLRHRYLRLEPFRGRS